MTASFDWADFEERLMTECTLVLTQLGKQHSEETFYVVTLTGVYRERDRNLSLPHIAANTVAAGAQNEGDFWGARWEPAEWAFPEKHLRNDQDMALERALTREAKAGSVAHWQKVETRYYRALLRITRRLRDLAPELLTVSNDFICFLHDRNEGVDLARKTIPKKLFSELFSQNVQHAEEISAVSRLDAKSRAKLLVTRFGMFEGITTEDAQAELLRMGEDAIPALIGALRDPKNGWTAAMVLSRIGIPSVEAVDALREMAAGGHWYSTALGSLGDHKWLATQPPDVAVHGLVAPFLAIASEGGAAPEFDYHPLEAFLTIQGDVASKLVESALKPGQSYRKLTASDVPEAVRGLTSKHAVIRWHACASLGNRSLGARCEKSILPALAVCLDDEHHLVRRLCALAIGRWKTAAQPYVQKLQVMITEDDNEVVRNIVKHALSNIG